MQSRPPRLSAIGQLLSDCTSDSRSRFWQTGDQPLHRAEVICPEPRRATISHVLDSLNTSSSKSKGISPVRKGNSDLEILEFILSKDGFEGDSEPSNEVGFFCGTPPARTGNPIVHDAQFTNQTLPSPPFGNFRGVKPSAKVERGSPSCGSSVSANPEVRIEGFTCANSDPHHRYIVSALA